MRLFATIAFASLLGACAQLQGLSQAYTEYRTEAHHAALRVALYRLCESASVDSIEDFFNTPELMQARNTICDVYIAPPTGELIADG